MAVTKWTIPGAPAIFIVVSEQKIVVKGWLNFAAGIIQPFCVLPARKGR
jgi:hypothetical protein